MKPEHKFFICKHCGNLIAMVHSSGAPIICCGEPMTELVPNTAEASTEKHLPVVTVSGNNVTVQVGSVLHPMDEAHLISFIYVATENGGQTKILKAGQEPKATFSLADDKAVAVYAYCNQHGLWKTEVK